MTRCLSRICRRFGTHHLRTVSVNVGSEDPVTIDLHNVPDLSPTDMLIIHLPPFPLGDDSLAPSVPEFLKEWPVASINYRWGPTAVADPHCKDEKTENRFRFRFRWPVPVHDTAIAFRWITENLMSWDNCKGNMFIYGSYLGASLATSLSLTESRPHDRFELRGLAAYNGIFNWTMLLPDHKINLEQQAKSANTIAATRPLAFVQSTQVDVLGMRMEALFDTPSNLFDPFASPSLFFYQPGLLIPKLFHMTATEAAMIQALTGYDKLFIKKMKPPTKAFLDFPPHDSQLRIPDSLLMHGVHDTNGTDRRQSSLDFQVQAEELLSLMRRSICVDEMKRREENKDKTAINAEDIHRRVQAADVGISSDDMGLSRRGQIVLLNWLRQRL